MDKVKAIIPRIFDSIKNRRPWIFIGYSGDDPIFKHIKELGRFDHGLYWVCYNDSNPNSQVQELIKTPNTNAFVIKGYDSDSFMLMLNKELGLSEPDILDKPFTSLEGMLSNVVDIDDKEHFKGVKERLDIVKRQVKEAIQRYEAGEPTASEAKKTEVDLLKKDIINLLISENFSNKAITDIEKRAQKHQGNDSVNEILSTLYLSRGTTLGKLAETKSGAEAEGLYLQVFRMFQKATELKPNYHQAFYNWGTSLGKLADSKSGAEAEGLYLQAFQMYRKATELKPDYHQAFYNWGYDLGRLAKTKSGVETEGLYLQAFQMYRKATELKPDYHQAFCNWGTGLGRLAKTKSGAEAEGLYLQAFQMYRKATELKPDDHQAFYNWGTDLSRLAETKSGAEAEDLYMQSFQMYRKATELKPDYHQAFCNWGTGLGKLAKTKSGAEAEGLYLQAFQMFQKATELKPDDHQAFCNWGNYLTILAKTKEENEADKLYQQAMEKLKKSVELGGNCYNLACLYAIRGNKKDALHYLGVSLEKKEESTTFVLEDKDWIGLYNDPDFTEVINKYRS